MKKLYNHLSAFFLLFALSFSLKVDGHSVQVGYCVSCTGELTLYVEHWHSNEDPSTTTMTIQLNINGVISTQTGSPSANLQDIPVSLLPGCANPITIFGSCAAANTYNDWAVYNFPALPTGVPIIITVLSGNTVFTEVATGCSMYPASTPQIIVPPFVNPPPVASQDATFCASGSTSLTLTGFIAAIQWQSAPTIGGPWTDIPGATTTPLATGTLTTTTYYRAIENGGCASNVVTISVNQGPTANAGSGSYAGSGSGLTSCPTNTPGNLGGASTTGYTYLWSPAGGLSSTTVSNPSVLLSNPMTTTYTLTTTAFDCTSTDSIKVTVNPAPLSNAGSDITSCITSTPGNLGTASTPGYTYSWSPSTGLSDATISNPTVALTALGTTSFTVTTTALTCSSTATVLVTVNPLPTATIAGTTAVCKDAVSPTITFTGANGTPPYTFTYTLNGGVNQTIPTTSSNSVTLTVPTTTAGVFTYSLVSVQDASSTTCSQLQSGSAIITVNPLPTATISGTTQVCKNAADPNITFTGAGGTPPYTFTYTINGAGQGPITTFIGNSVSIAASSSADGTFIYDLISVKDASSTACSQLQSGTATITVNPLPTATVSGTTAVCKNAGAPSITFTGAGATAPYTFTYMINSGGNQTLSTLTGNSITVVVPTDSAGSYTYSIVSVQDASTTACSQAQNGGATITVNPLPTATIAGTTIVCKNDPAPGITFTGASATPPYTFTYTVNGIIQPTVTSTGNTVTVSVPTFVAGTFTYALTSVKDASSTTCSQAQTGSATVTVNPLPTATIAGTTAVCRYSAAPGITFTGASGTPPYTFTYTINTGANLTVTSSNGNSATVPAPTNILGTFTYDLVSVKDASPTTCSQLQTGSETIIINPLPVADFNFTNICLNQAMVFSDASTVTSGSTVGWLWNFGDNSGVDTAKNPVYTYTNFGTFNVSLITTTNNGCKDTIAKNTIVHPNPTVLFTTANVCDGTNVQFSESSTIPVTDTLQTWEWNFGDGSSYNLNQMVTGGHLYPGPATYTVELTVVSSFGCTDSLSKTVVVNPNPLVNFGASDTAGCELLCLFFIDSSSIYTGSNVSWSWNVGDGSPLSNSQNFDHCYSNDEVYAPLPFNISLTVTSDSGCVTSLTKANYITVYPEPTANFSAAPATESIINPVILITDSTAGADFWSWDFGDMDTSFASQPVSHMYADTGTYTITLITSTQYGCADTTSRSISIGPDVAFYIPNGFTPNNDGKNDTFFPKGIFISDYEMMIFDRWGNLIYFTDEMEKGWDGRADYGATQAQNDVYVYSIKGTDIKRKKRSYSGIVTLIR
ncbi:MAG: PKD domain-containing protein [Bacteroidota bacterium]